MKHLLSTIMVLSLAFAPLKAQLSIVEIMYNNPGEDIYEYVKIWNNSGEVQSLSGMSISAGFQVDFPDEEIGVNQWFFVVADSAAFVNDLNQAGSSTFLVIESDGALNNGGETITLSDANGLTVDEVTYDDGDGWPTFADGEGSAILYCGGNGGDKNDPDNWSLTPTTLGVTINDQPLYGLLGDISFQCNERGSATFFSEATTVLEGDGVVNIPLYIDRALQNSVTLTLTDASGTAISGDDYQLITQNITSDTDSVDVFNIQVSISDDSDLESDESFFLNFVPFSPEYLSLTNSIEVTIIDNDTPLTEGLILTGVFDAQPGFSGTKGAEFYAIQDIPDLGVYGVGVVNNGSGTDGVEYTFPTGPIAAGTFIYLAEDETEFLDYFGFAPDYVFGSINVNGNDAIELFENAQPLDVFGDANMDGSGLAWEYLDGWAYRVSGTTQDGSLFSEGNWMYSGIDALDGPATNAEASIPFPIGTFSTVASTLVEAQDDMLTLPFGTTEAVIAITGNDVIPGDIISVVLTTLPNTITAEVTDTFTLSLVIPDGFSGQEMMTYELSNGTSVSSADVTVIVEAQVAYPIYDIVTVTEEDAAGVADSIDVTCELRGVVHGVNLSTSGVLFTIIDQIGNGIAVFSGDPDIGYTVQEGDEIAVRGTITQFNGLTEIIADEIELLSQNNATAQAGFVGQLDEFTESKLIAIQGGYQDITQWGGGTSGFNFTIMEGTNEFEVRIDSEVDLFLLPAPGEEGDLLNIVGIGGQFDNSSPLDGGYQILPRYAADITFGPGGSAKDVLGIDIDMYPNPAAMTLNLNSEENLDAVNIMDALGRLVIQIDNPALQTVIDVNDLERGIYTVQCVKDGSSYTLKLIVQ